jgi:hypothetical protein
MASAYLSWLKHTAARVLCNSHPHEGNEQRCAAGPVGLPTLPEKRLAPAQSKRPESRFAMKKNVWRAVISSTQILGKRASDFWLQKKQQ